jgi:hypothetical protein
MRKGLCAVSGDGGLIAEAGIAATAWDQNEQLKNALLKKGSDAKNGLVCVAVASGFQIVSKLIDQFSAGSS